MSLESYIVVPSLTREHVADILSQHVLRLVVNKDVTSFDPTNFATVGFMPKDKVVDDSHALIRGEMTAPPEYAGRPAALTTSWLIADNYRTILDIGE